jgi:carbon-monoxide dehydrogenase medium subunit
VQEFHYHAPRTLKEAIALLSRPGARPLAGGTDLITQIRERRRLVGDVVDLKRVPELTALFRTEDGSWSIGGAVSVGELGRNSRFASECTAVLEAAQLIGSLQIQNRAGLGGNICNAAPSADGVPLLICLDAMAELDGPGDRRTVPVSSIACGPGRTSLAAGEFLVSIRLPMLRERSSAKYLRFTPRREMDIAIAGVGAWFALDADGVIIEARLTLASVAPTPLIAKAAQQSLRGRRPSLSAFEQAAALAAEEAKPISDSRGSADYRRELIKVLTQRTLAACATDLECTLS